MPPNPPSEVRTSLRLSPEIHDLIVAECAKRPGRVSVNTWILEAINERLRAVGSLPPRGDAVGDGR